MGKLVLGCLFTALFCMVKPALAHEHCDIGANHPGSHGKIGVIGEIPDPNAKTGAPSGGHSSACGLAHMTSTRHCNMGHCYLSCGDADSPSTTDLTGNREFAESNFTAYFHDFYQFRFYLLKQEPALRISFPPDPRPPAA